MIMQIACGIVVGYIMLAAIVFLLLFFSAFISKHDTLRTMKKYDFEEGDDYDDDYE